jgi:multidrug transporter EmrE-like cation transporter
MWASRPPRQNPKMNLKGLPLNLLCASSAVLSNAVLKHVLTGRFRWQGSVTALVLEMFQLIREPLMWLGGLAFIATNVLWLLILSTQQMSVAYPLQISLVFLLSTAVSVLVFSDKLNATGYAGLALLLTGILLLRQGTSAA